VFFAFCFNLHIIRPHRSTTYVVRPIVTDCIAWYVGLSLCLSVTLVSPAKKAEAIDISFELRTRVGPRNHVLDGGLDPSGKGQFWGIGTHNVKYRDFLP